MEIENDEILEVSKFVSLAFTEEAGIEYFGKCIVKTPDLIGLANIHVDEKKYDGVSFFKTSAIELYRELDEEERVSDSFEIGDYAKIESFDDVLVELLKANTLCAVYYRKDFENFYFGRVVRVANKKVYLATFDSEGYCSGLQRLHKKNISGLSFGSEYEKEMQTLLKECVCED